MADYDFAKIEKKLSKYLDEDRSAYHGRYVHQRMSGYGPWI